MELLIKNCNVVDSGKRTIKQLDLHIRNGIIKNIGKDLNNKCDKVINVNGALVLPGLVDIHVHFREPGYEYKETIKTGSLAAAKGGFTTVAIMPNTNPVIDNVEVLDNLKEIIKRDACIKVLPIGTVTKGQKGEKLVDIKSLYENGVYGFSDDGQPIMNEEIMNKAVKQCDELQIPIMIHSEDKRYVNDGCINLGRVSEKLKVKGISRDAENVMIKRDIEIARNLKLSIHICHVSTKEAVCMIRQAKQDGVKVTCEVAPHHFSITENIILEKQAIGKVNPPLRTYEDIEEIIKGIKDGTVDAIATDHAPHSKEEKQLDIQKAPFGLTGIELALPITNTYLLEKAVIDIFDLVNLMSINPRKIMGMDSRGIEIGAYADITIIDLDEEYILNESDIISKGKNTPFIGMKLKGKVKYTICDGKIVYEEE